MAYYPFEPAATLDTIEIPERFFPEQTVSAVFDQLGAKGDDLAFVIKMLVDGGNLWHVDISARTSGERETPYLSDRYRRHVSSLRFWPRHGEIGESVCAEVTPVGQDGYSLSSSSKLVYRTSIAEKDVSEFGTTHREATTLEGAEAKRVKDQLSTQRDALFSLLKIPGNVNDLIPSLTQMFEVVNIRPELAQSVYLYQKSNESEVLLCESQDRHSFPTVCHAMRFTSSPRALNYLWIYPIGEQQHLTRATPDGFVSAWSEKITPDTPLVPTDPLTAERENIIAKARRIHAMAQTIFA